MPRNFRQLFSYHNANCFHQKDPIPSFSNLFAFGTLCNNRMALFVHPSGSCSGKSDNGNDDYFDTGSHVFCNRYNNSPCFIQVNFLIYSATQNDCISLLFYIIQFHDVFHDFFTALSLTYGWCFVSFLYSQR